MANPRGQQRDKPFREALRMEIAAAQDDANPRSLRAIARKLLDRAGEGDIQAIKEIADRLDGKVPQGIGGDDELPPIATELSDEQVARRIAFLLAEGLQGKDKPE
jgi:hypothetical protein